MIFLLRFLVSSGDDGAFDVEYILRFAEMDLFELPLEKKCRIRIIVETFLLLVF
jgi:hypothetical protein